MTRTARSGKTLLVSRSPALHRCRRHGHTSHSCRNTAHCTLVITVRTWTMTPTFSLLLLGDAGPVDAGCLPISKLLNTAVTVHGMLLTKHSTRRKISGGPVACSPQCIAHQLLIVLGNLRFTMLRHSYFYHIRVSQLTSDRSSGQLSGPIRPSWRSPK